MKKTTGGWGQSGTILCLEVHSPSSHLPYTLPSSVSCKFFACHSYENTGGVGVFFPFWNSSPDVPTFQRSDVPTFRRSNDFLALHYRLHCGGRAACRHARTPGNCCAST